MTTLITPLPSLDDNNLLSSMLDNPISWDQGIHRQSTKELNSLRIVKNGPQSPPSSFQRLINGKPSTPKSDSSPASDPGSDGEDEKIGINGNDQSSGSPSQPPRSIPQQQQLTPKQSQSQASSSKLPPQPTPALTPTSTSTSRISDSTPLTTKINPEDLYTIPIDSIWPEPIASLKRPAAGLHNPSMACYANATLQVLLHTPPVLKIAIEHDEARCSRHTKNMFCMLCELREMAIGSHWDTRRAYIPHVHNYLKYIKKGFSKNRQEDTHEFFRFVTDALQVTALTGQPKDLPEKIKHSSWVYKVWGGKVRSRVVCSRCNKPSDTFDWFLDLSLDVNKAGQKSIKNMMNGFTREDKLEGDNKYHCDNCKAKANATKTFKIDQAPPILTLHLKRFSVDYNSYSGRARANKFNGPIEYSEFLDIAPYMVDPKAGGTTYRLFGVTCHRGVELRFGHYTSYVKGPHGQWYEADDDDMTPVKLSQVLGDKTAYLLSYIRVSDGSMPTPTSTQKTNGSTDGHLPSPTTPKIGDKRSRQDGEEDIEEEEVEEKEVNILKPRKSINGFIESQKPMTIRKSTPPQSRPSTSQQGQEEKDLSLPPPLPTPTKFGSLLPPKQTSSSPKIYAPKPIPPNQFYNHSTKSPISRPPHPRPDSSSISSQSNSVKMSKKDLKKMARFEKKNKKKLGSSHSHGHGNGNPYKAATLGSKESKTKWGKMKGRS
ncbi:uncharacterized protein IL334_000167 [Kwoniella shivajii]|uniref:ubiquitinyl hydrolase 1 n=1 Tax=Kwoniella shivajii TaxID=564305 RepID=A0ABZ1CNE3_9TREE|nr:hypothetical protein IL334_000167 [Kwoniella shivajii]